MEIQKITSKEEQEKIKSPFLYKDKTLENYAKIIDIKRHDLYTLKNKKYTYGYIIIDKIDDSLIYLNKDLDNYKNEIFINDCYINKYYRKHKLGSFLVNNILTFYKNKKIYLKYESEEARLFWKYNNFKLLNDKIMYLNNN